MSYTTLRRRHRLLSVVTNSLAMILTGFVAYGCYLFVQSPPAAGIAAAVVGVLVVALGYLSWGVCGDCLSRRWYPSAFFAALVSASISGCVMFVIHQTIVHSSEQQKAALLASEHALGEATRQLESDRAMYQSLLTPVEPVVSAERAGLQNTIRDFQEQARIKRLKNYDKPADRIDDNVVKLQSRLSELMLIDADANARVDRARAEQAASLLDSIKKREAMAVQAPVVVVTTLSERVMLIAAVLIELITSGMMLYLARLKGVLDAELASEKVSQESAAKPPAPALVLTPAQAPKEPVVEAAPVEPVKALDEPVYAQVAPQEPHEPVREAGLPQAEPSPTTAVEVAPEAAPAAAVPPVVVEYSQPAPVAPAAAPEPNPEPDLMMGLKPHEKQRYSTFREHLLQMPPDEAIKTDSVAAALGFGKDLVSTFFKIAGQQSVIQKQGRQWFLYVGN
ncbi:MULTISPECIES: hypothetical protein [unclassified Pseudomonas]|uniref:hypothetical protein n=1 Tax=unclassified Pseudomonas TaxID=196821 RepID=UPI0012FE4109|nr:MULTISPECIES: hypothetical protein [unclassified Pseudomonas]